MQLVQFVQLVVRLQVDQLVDLGLAFHPMAVRLEVLRLVLEGLFAYQIFGSLLEQLRRYLACRHHLVDHYHLQGQTFAVLQLELLRRQIRQQLDQSLLFLRQLCLGST